VSFVVGMVWVSYDPRCPAILNVHRNAWRARLGSLSRLFDLGTFDRFWRRSLRQLVGERLTFCR